MLSTGFIGLGAMGVGMARNLHKRGLLTHVWNRTTDKAVGLAAELGVQAAASIADLASKCDVIVMCVSADEDVLQTIAAIGPQGRPQTIVIDCSTVSANTARAAAKQLAQRQMGFLDAPVSGGVEGAQKGTLAIMVGGDENI